MAITTVLFNDFVAIERDLQQSIPCDDNNYFSGTVVAISIFVTQVSVGDLVLYKNLLTYTDVDQSLDIASESNVILKMPSASLP